jgi:hypothetical protein
MQKIMVSARIPPYIKKYFSNNNISISQALEFAFQKYRETEKNYCVKKWREAEENVLHWKQKVLHFEQECNTKQQKCNTIKETFLDLGRGNPDMIKQDKAWLEPKVEQLQKEGVSINVNELYEYCIMG